MLNRNKNLMGRSTTLNLPESTLEEPLILNHSSCSAALDQ